MIRQLILLIVALALLLAAAKEGQTIQVMIVLPPELVPYYEWLLSFPGWQQPEKQPPYHSPAGLQTCHPASHIRYSTAIAP